MILSCTIVNGGGRDDGGGDDGDDGGGDDGDDGGGDDGGGGSVRLQKLVGFQL